MKKTTLCYIEKDGKYLMLFRNKKENDINAGKWIGIGGHIEDGETPDECLQREVREETGLKLLNYKYRGLVHFISGDYKEDMYLYTSDRFCGNLTDCDEGELHWIEKDKVTELNIWDGDRVFLKKLLNDESGFEITLRYD